MKAKLLEWPEFQHAVINRQKNRQGQMKQFVCGCDAFASFDWMDQTAPVEADHRDYYFNKERRRIEKLMNMIDAACKLIVDQ